jgi:hypothetical protein
MNVRAKAAALAAAWPRVTGAPPNKNAIRLCLAQATHESHCGDDWPLSNNWGCCDYRPCNAAELVAITNGQLADGSWLYADGTFSSAHRPDAVAQMHTDVHPGGVRYHTWFAAFPDDVAGAAYYLKIAWRMAGAVLACEQATATDFATACYVHGYFEGVHPGARPVGRRTLPLTPPEAANVADYASAMNKVLPEIDAALQGWMDTTIETSDPAAGQEPEPAA